MSTLSRIESVPASAVPSVDAVYDQLTCAMCLELFNLNARNPRLLDCGHSFGTDCLQRVLSQDNCIKCVLCDKVHNVADANIASVPSNTFLCELLEQLPKRALNAMPSGGAATHTPNCSQCHRAKPGTHSCEECRLLYCSVHAAAHEVDHETHHVVVVAAGGIASPHAHGVDKRARCVAHDKDYEAYCNTCMVPVCVSCTIFSHRGTNHDLIDLRKARQAALDGVLGVLPDAEQRVQNLAEVLSQYQQTREQLLQSMNETSASVAAYFNSLILQLEKRRDALCAENEATVMEHVRSMGVKEHSLDQHVRALRACSSYARQEVEKENFVSLQRVPLSPANGVARSRPVSHGQRILMLNRMRADLAARINEHAADPALFVWPEVVVTRFIVAAPASSALPTQALGDLFISTVSVPDTLVRGDLLEPNTNQDGALLKTVRAGERCEVTVQLRDSSVRTVPQTGWVWSAKLQPLGGRGETVVARDVRIRDLGAGGYAVSFAAAEGAWRLVLVTRGQELPVVEFAATGGDAADKLISITDPMFQLTARTRSQTLNLIELFSASNRDEGAATSAIKSASVSITPVAAVSTMPASPSPPAKLKTPVSTAVSSAAHTPKPSAPVTPKAAATGDAGETVEQLRLRARAEVEEAEAARRRADLEASASAAATALAQQQEIALEALHQRQQQQQQQQQQLQEQQKQALLAQQHAATQAAEEASVAALTRALELEHAAAALIAAVAEADAAVVRADEKCTRARVAANEIRTSVEDAHAVVEEAASAVAALQARVQVCVAATTAQPDNQALAHEAERALEALQAAIAHEAEAHAHEVQVNARARLVEDELRISEAALVHALDEHEQKARSAEQATSVADQTSAAVVGTSSASGSIIGSLAPTPPLSARVQQLERALAAAVASREQTPHGSSRGVHVSARANAAASARSSISASSQGEPANAVAAAVASPKRDLSHQATPMAAVTNLAEDALALLEQARIIQRSQPVVAFELLQRAAALNSPEAFGELSHCYQFAQGTSKNAQLAFDFAWRGHEAGNLLATSALARCFRTGTGVERDAAQAFALFTRAAEGGEAWGLCGLGVCYDDGIGCEKSATRAAECYEAAAALGHAQSISIIGLCYANGSGVAKDTTRAVEFYRRGAALGHANSICNLGVCFENGTGVEKDIVQSVACYQRGAELGHAHSMYYLGLCYEFGKGALEKSKDAAKMWFKRAADLGDADAKKRLK